MACRAFAARLTHSLVLSGTYLPLAESLKEAAQKLVDEQRPPLEIRSIMVLLRNLIFAIHSKCTAWTRYLALTHKPQSLSQAQSPLESIHIPLPPRMSPSISEPLRELVQSPQEQDTPQRLPLGRVRLTSEEEKEESQASLLLHLAGDPNSKESANEVQRQGSHDTPRFVPEEQLIPKPENRPWGRLCRTEVYGEEETEEGTNGSQLLIPRPNNTLPFFNK